MVNFGPLTAEICWRVFNWGTPANFNGFRVLAALLYGVTARHSSSGRQPNFAALNRRRYLYCTGRPSRWALASILVFAIFLSYARVELLLISLQGLSVECIPMAEYHVYIT